MRGEEGEVARFVVSNVGSSREMVGGGVARRDGLFGSIDLFVGRKIVARSDGAGRVGRRLRAVAQKSGGLLEGRGQRGGAGALGDFVVADEVALGPDRGAAADETDGAMLRLCDGARRRPERHRGMKMSREKRMTKTGACR